MCVSVAGAREGALDEGAGRVKSVLLVLGSCLVGCLAKADEAAPGRKSRAFV